MSERVRNLVEKILKGAHVADQPIAGLPRKRIVGFVIDFEDTGFTEGAFALQEIVRLAKQSATVG